MGESTNLQQTENTDNLVENVILDASVVLRILHHNSYVSHLKEQQMNPTGMEADGILTGILVGKNLEVTHCFPRLISETNEENYIYDYLECFKDCNFDYVRVGGYISVVFGKLVDKRMLDDMIGLMGDTPETILLTYDHTKSSYGTLWLKAYRPSATASRLPKLNDCLTKEYFVNIDHLLKEIPIIYRTSTLNLLALHELKTINPKFTSYQHLKLPNGDMVNQLTKFLNGSLEVLSQDTNKFLNYYRQLRKQLAGKQNTLKRIEQENAIRENNGEELKPIPTTEELNQEFPAPTEASYLDILFVGFQAKLCVNEYQSYVIQNLIKLFIAGAGGLVKKSN
ncbi:hypothetical protein SNEBB_001449 [Seison nebaliae]|nr:hypothetical protein SNEBB_001449 [Seison nebaliae]